MSKEGEVGDTQAHLPPSLPRQPLGLRQLYSSQGRTLWVGKVAIPPRQAPIHLVRSQSGRTAVKASSRITSSATQLTPGQLGMRRL